MTSRRLRTDFKPLPTAAKKEIDLILERNPILFGIVGGVDLIRDELLEIERKYSLTPGQTWKYVHSVQRKILQQSSPLPDVYHNSRKAAGNLGAMSLLLFLILVVFILGVSYLAR